MSGRAAALLLAAGAGLVGLVLTTGIPARNHFLGLLNNAGHAPIFGALAWILLRLFQAQWRAAWPAPLAYAAAFAATIALGAVVEVVQSFIDRDASWIDLAMDAAGAATVLGVAAAVEAGRRRIGGVALGLAVAAVGVGVVAWPLVEATVGYARRAEIFPALARFERVSDLYFLRPSGATAERILLPEPWAEGQAVPVLALRLDRDRSPGLRLVEPVRDWRRYERFKLEVVNPGEQPLRFIVRIHDAWHDQRHDDRLNLAFTVQAGSRRVVEVPLATIEAAPRGRRMDMSRIAGIVLFESSRPAPVGATFYLTRLWLE